MALSLKLVLLGCIAAVAYVDGFRISPQFGRRRNTAMLLAGRGGGGMVRPVSISAARQHRMMRRTGGLSRGFGSRAGILFGGDAPDMPDLPDFSYYGVGALGGLGAGSLGGASLSSSLNSYHTHKLLEDIDSPGLMFG